MNRRELLKLIAAATGGVVIGGEFFLSGCSNPDKGVSMTFSEDDVAFLDEVAETILPKTTSAGAKEAGVGRYMTVYVNDCYTQEDQEIFHKGMKELDDACDKMHGHGFMKATPEQRTALLKQIDKETKDYNDKKKKLEDEIKEKSKQGQEKTAGSEQQNKPMSNHYFHLMKQITIAGYFSSEKGRKEALRYNPIPGKWQGVIDYKKGEKSFAGLT